MKKSSWFLPLLLAIPLFAVTPQFWETRSYDEFRGGKLTNLSLTSDNELILAPRFDTVYDTQQTLIWSAQADSAGNIYLGTGHDGKLFKVDSGGNGSLLADLSELDVTALAIDNSGTLYAATSPDGKVYRIQAGQEPVVFYDPDARYIWSMLFDGQGRLLVATGDKGVIYRVAADGAAETFYDTDETHVISMALDANGNVIAGGDPKGYIYRISPDGRAFVLYDSGMREVHDVAVAPDGRIYAAVLSTRPPMGGAAVPAAVPAPPDDGLEPSISITVGSTGASAQQVEVITSESTVVAPPRSATRTSGADANAQSLILEIQPDGVVNTLWRSSDEMVFSILPSNGRMLFSTGTKGRIYSLEDPRSTTLLLETTEQQTTRLLSAGDNVFAATANVGKLFRMGTGPATSGTFESVVRDTDAISTWGKLSSKAQNGDLIQIFTRSGNTNTPDRTWSDWVAIDSSGATTSPKARFLQWKAEMRADAARSPRLNSVTVPYLQQNFSPEVTEIEVLPPGVSLLKLQSFNAAGQPVAGNDQATARANARAGMPAPPQMPPRRLVQKGAQSFQWKATDKNQDQLRYDIYYRGENERAWKVLKQNVEDDFYTINSDTLPDGLYVLRVVAHDLPSNPVELAMSGEADSEIFSIDNTPPSVEMRRQNIESRRVRIAIEAADATSTLNQAEISVDAGEWRSVFPADGILDSGTESFSILTDELTTGEHVIAFRIYDENDNVGMARLVVRIP